MQFLRTPRETCKQLSLKGQQSSPLHRPMVLLRAHHNDAADHRVDLPKELTVSRGEDREDLDEYFVTLKTGLKRGSAISEPLSRVFLCLIGSKRKGSLHFITPLTETGQSSTKQRFLQGAVDTVRVSNPQLGPLTGLLIGPESGTWYLDEVLVQSEATGETMKFVCRKELGTKTDPAALLTPLPPGTLIYGSGSTALYLTNEQAEKMQQTNLESYRNLKQNILFVNAAYVALGSVVEALVWDVPFASLYALGGAGGLLYEYLLQESVDLYGADPTDESSTIRGKLKEFLASPVSRVLLSVLLIITVYSVLQFMEPDSKELVMPSYRAQQILNFAIGFLMFKVATVNTVLVSNSMTRHQTSDQE